MGVVFLNEKTFFIIIDRSSDNGLLFHLSCGGLRNGI